MPTSTWHAITNGLHAAVHDSYMAKSSRQRARREVQDVMHDVDAFCQATRQQLAASTYQVGAYRHFRLHDRKKARDISVLPYGDRCVQNAIKDAIQPVLMHQMTDDMLGGLPGCGVLAGGTDRRDPDRRHQVVERVRRLMNDRSLRYYLQGDIRKFYDTIDNVTAMRLIERQVKDKRTRAVVRQHLFNQKRLAIGDPFSHLIANLVMSQIIRKTKDKYGRRIRLVNFADDFLAFAKDKDILVALRRDLRQWAKTTRLHYKPMYVRPVPDSAALCRLSGDSIAGIHVPHPITFCGYKYGRGFVHLTRRTKQRYIRARHKRRSMGSYQGIISVADTKHLKIAIQFLNNRKMIDSNKIRRRFAGRVMKVDTIEGIAHTIVDFEKKDSTKNFNGRAKSQHREGDEPDKYYQVQAISDAFGLFVYNTGAPKITKYLDTKTLQDLPIRDKTIVHDWSGIYYEGTVTTDAEEEALIREQYNLPKQS